MTKRLAIVSAGVASYVGAWTLVVVLSPQWGADQDARLMIGLAAASVLAGLAVGRWDALPLVVLAPFLGAAVARNWDVGWEIAYASPFPFAFAIAFRRAWARRRPPRPIVLCVLVAYVASSLTLVYGVLDTARADDPFWDGGLARLALVLGVQVLVGFAIGEWWATVLAAVPCIVALPAGDNPHLGGDFTAPALVLAFGMPYFFALLAAGVAVRRVVGRTHLPQRDMSGV